MATSSNFPSSNKSLCTPIPITVLSIGEVLACNTASVKVVTGVGVAVALTLSTLGEAPEPYAATVAGTSVGVLDTRTLPGLLVTEVVPGTDVVAVASWRQKN